MIVVGRVEGRGLEEAGQTKKKQNTNKLEGGKEGGRLTVLSCPKEKK